MILRMDGAHREMAISVKVDPEVVLRGHHDRFIAQLADDMGGFIGELSCEGNLQEFMSLLILGQYTHIGKDAVWGHGQYEVAASR